MKTEDRKADEDLKNPLNSVEYDRSGLQPAIPGEPMQVIVAKLAALRETYFKELEAARKKVKDNFLR